MIRIASRVSAALLVASTMLGCGGGAPQSEVPRPREGSGFSLAEHDGRPRVVSLERTGDPASGVALFLERSTRDPDVHAALGALLSERLGAAAFGLEVRADATGVLLSSYVRPSTARAWVDAVDAALRRPVQAAELKAVSTRLSTLVRTADSGRSVADACRGALVTRGGAAPPLASLERARNLAFAAERATIGVVGDDATVNAIVERVAALATWPAPAPEAIPDPEVPAVSAVRSAELGARQERVTVSRFVPDASSAVAAARAVRDDPRSFVARLRAVSGKGSLTGLTGVALARGGCVGLEITFDVDDAAPPARHEVAALALAESGRPTVPDPGLAYAIPAALTDARDAALVAARWHTPRVTGAARQNVLVELPPMASDDDLARARASVERATSTAPTQARFVTRDETGQGALWVAIGPACAPERSGLRGYGEAGLGILSLVGEGKRDDGVEVEALPGFGGLVAHAEPRAGESARALATRVAGALGRAYYADVPPADVVLVARGVASRWLEAGWGRDGTAVEDFAEVLSPSAPDAIEALGSMELVRTFDAALASRTTRALMRRPVVVGALLDQPGSDESAAVRAILGEHARGLPEDACTPRSAVRVPVRRVEVPTRLRGGVGLVRLGFAGSVDEDFLLGVLAELLSEAATRPDGGATLVVRHRRDGEPLVHVEIRAREEVLAAAVQRFDALLTRLSRGELTEQAIRAAIARADLATTTDAADPRNRLARLLAGRTVETPRSDPAAVRAWLTKRVAPGAWSGVIVHGE